MAENDSEGYEVFGRLVDSAHRAYVADNMTWEWLGRAVVCHFGEAFAQVSLNKVPLVAYSNVRGRETVLAAAAVDAAKLLERIGHLEGSLKEATAALSKLRAAVRETTPSAEDMASGTAAKVAEACARARDVLKLLVPGSTTTPEGERT